MSSIFKKSYFNNMEASLKIRLTLVITLLAISKSSTNSLGSNILLNSGFQMPAFNTTTQLNFLNKLSAEGWTCLDYCEYVSIPYMCSHLSSSYCPMASNNQMLNLQSGSKQNITQFFNISKSSSYLLSFEWLPPFSNQIGKSLSISLNGKIIDTISINGSNYQISNINNYSIQFDVSSGSNQIEFLSLGFDNGYGIFIDNVYLQEIINSGSGGSSGGTSTNSNGGSSTNSGSGNINSGSGSTNGNGSTNNNTTSNNSTANNNAVLNNNTTPNYTNALNQNNTTLSDRSRQFLEFMLNNSFTKIINLVPGSRVFFSYLTGFHPNFDRLQFYFYHKQNFTQYATVFLFAINFFKQQQGSLLQLLFESQSSKSPLDVVTQAQSNLESALNFKANFTNEYFSSKNPNGFSFAANQVAFFYYELPFMLFVHFLFWLIFLLTKEHRISVHLRKYCFLGIVFFLVFEGNLQQFAFYFFAECRLLYSANLRHKFFNLLIISFGFGVFFFVFAALLFFYRHYGKRAKYFVEGCKLHLISFVSVCVDCGVAPLASAVIHILFLQELLLLTVLLTVMELSWIAAKVYFLHKRIYSSKVRVLIHIANNSLRVVFLISLYAFQNGEDYSTMNNIHLCFMVSYLSLWVLELLLAFIAFIFGFITFVKKLSRNNRVTTKDQKMKKENQKNAKKSNIFIEQITDKPLKVNPRHIPILKYRKQIPKLSNNFYCQKTNKGNQNNLEGLKISEMIQQISQMQQDSKKQKTFILRRKIGKATKFKPSNSPNHLAGK